jgi:hypothetical protein
MILAIVATGRCPWRVHKRGSGVNPGFSSRTTLQVYRAIPDRIDSSAEIQEGPIERGFFEGLMSLMTCKKYDMLIVTGLRGSISSTCTSGECMASFGGGL